MKQAKFYQKKENHTVKCVLCPNECIILPGKRGTCGVRQNQEGTLFSLVYGKTISLAMDPIEKKPLYHFLPGEKALSLATVGCNFSCLNCQNYTISQAAREAEEIPGEKASPEKIVNTAKKRGAKIIAYTYTEPTIFYEYAYDTCRIAHQEGVKNVFVTNGYIMPEPLKQISPFLDGANVDLKSMREEIYRKTCKGRLQPVLDTIKLMKELGIWIEVTTLVIPGINDTPRELRSIAEFIFQIDSSIPWHLSRFFPTYKMQDHPPTPVETLHRAQKIGKQVGLNHIYIGNVPTREGSNTSCPNCEKTVIERSGYRAGQINLDKGRCRWCQNKIAGVWE